MSDGTDTRTKPPGRWISTISLAVAHLIAFGMLYLVVVQMNWAFQDFFKLVDAEPTPRFETISKISDFIAAYTPIVLLVIAFDIFIIFRLSRSASRWTSAYSHAALLCMGFTGFLWTAWAVHTMAWGAPRIANPPGAAAPGQQIDRLAKVVVSSSEQ